MAQQSARVVTEIATRSCCHFAATCRIMQMPSGRQRNMKREGMQRKERGGGSGEEEPVACDPIFAPINKFNAQTPGMREHIKNENYILPRSCQAHTQRTLMYCICTYASQGKSTLCVCEHHICINIIMKRKI